MSAIRKSVSVRALCRCFLMKRRLSAVAWHRGLRWSRMCQAYQQFRWIAPQLAMRVHDPPVPVHARKTYKTIPTKRLMRRYRRKIKAVVWLDKPLIFNRTNLDESRQILETLKITMSIYVSPESITNVIIQKTNKDVSPNILKQFAFSVQYSPYHLFIN